MEIYDIVVVGGGNAALCAALEARQCASRVLVLERAPEHMRGGNSRHTRNIRCAHPIADQFFSGPYSEDEYLADLVQVTGGPANPDLAKILIRESGALPAWMSRNGAHWQHPLAGTLHLGRTNRWFLGGGKALLNSYYRTAIHKGIEVRYSTSVEDLIIENGRFEAAFVKSGSTSDLVRGRAVVVATGGFEANLDWLKQSWGEAANNFIVRGTPFNDGKLLTVLLKRGAKRIGDPKAVHAIAVDARAPKYDGGIVTRLDSIPFGIVVNRLGRRFYDEGEEIWPKRYAIWGGLIAEQPCQLAYSILDAKSFGRFLPPVFRPYESPSVRGLANSLGIDPEALSETIEQFNRATSNNRTVRMDGLDGVSTRSLLPPKSNWALPIDTPPYYALPLKPGITFTYMGVTVDERARVLDGSYRPFKNVYAAGEIMSGNILTKGYLAGIGMTIGSVFGKIAGKAAAADAGR